MCLSVFSDSEDSDHSSKHDDVLSLQANGSFSDVNSDHESHGQSSILVKKNNNNLSEAA